MPASLPSYQPLLPLPGSVLTFNTELLFATPDQYHSTTTPAANLTSSSSLPLVEKVVGLLKAYVLSCPPGPELLALLDDFCGRVAELPAEAGLSGQGRKAVHLRGSLGRSRDDLSNLSRLAGGGSGGDNRGGLGGGTGSVIKLSMSATSLSGAGSGRPLNDRYAAAEALSSPSGDGMGAAGATVPPWLRQSDGRGVGGARGYEDLRLPPPQQAALGVEPAWAQLPMSEADVAVVVEAMCGSILMKLIIDMWQRCGPVGSYTLVLRMLRAALRSSQPSTRARAFDVLYNLSVHGAMLRGDTRRRRLAHRNHAWLRALLFQLLCDLCERAEYAEEVWRAAMGATSQLCAHGGHWVAGRVAHLPPAALAGLLRAACNLAWSQELYGHLLRLVPHVLSLEVCCADSMMSPQGSLRTHMEVSLAHISGGGGGGAGGGLNASLGNPLPPPALSAAGVGAAWRAFKEVCCEESAEARQVAIHWLHKWNIALADALLHVVGADWGVVGDDWGVDDWQDRRLALLLLLMARCSLDPEAFAKYSLSHVIKAQLSCEDLRCRYYAGVYLLKHWMLNQHDRYWRSLRHIIGTAQQLNDERLLDNPYLQMRTMLNVDHA
eukprot:XP_001691706.1 predicted protein [Chlamydomonas reinhardtii]